MEEVIKINQEHKDFILKYAPGQDIGGFSNLSPDDLKKSSRLGFQYTGIYGELAWYIYRYGSYQKLGELLDFKFKNLRPAKKGDDGFDDKVEKNGLTRLIDIKSTHVSDKEWIPKLNLIIPEREYHKNMIYVCAFTVGNDSNDRLNVNEVILSGWCANEHVVNRWSKDPKKYAVPVSNLKKLSVLKKIL